MDACDGIGFDTLQWRSEQQQNNEDDDDNSNDNYPCTTDTTRPTICITTWAENATKQNPGSTTQE